jgi:hypothetical protein
LCVSSYRQPHNHQHCRQNQADIPHDTPPCAVPYHPSGTRSQPRFSAPPAFFLFRPASIFSNNVFVL